MDTVTPSANLIKVDTWRWKYVASVSEISIYKKRIHVLAKVMVSGH